MRRLGIIFIILGVLGVADTGSIWLRPVRMVPVGSIRVVEDHRHDASAMPIAGGAALAAGVVFVLADALARAGH